MEENVQAKTRLAVKTVMIVMLLIVMLLLCISGINKINDSKYNTAETEATVTDITEHVRRRGFMKYTVRGEYNADGDKYKFRIETNDEYSVGQLVDIHYDPDDPDDYYVGEDPKKSMLFVEGIGLPVLTVMLLYLIFGFRTVPKKKKSPYDVWKDGRPTV